MPLYDDIEENFKRGVLDMLVLKLLSKEDMYGYQMAAAINEQSKGNIDVKIGSLYGPLYRMIERGYISEHKELVGKRRTRVYYHIEQPGIDFLNALVEIYTRMNEGVESILNDNSDGGQANEQ